MTAPTPPDVRWSPSVPGVFVAGKFGGYTRYGWRPEHADLPADAVRLVPESTLSAPTWEAYHAASHALNVWHTRRREALRLLADWETADALGTVEEWVAQIRAGLAAPIPAGSPPACVPGCATCTGATEWRSGR